jgi:hypothetical protein
MSRKRRWLESGRSGVAVASRMQAHGRSREPHQAERQHQRCAAQLQGRTHSSRRPPCRSGRISSRCAP